MDKKCNRQILELLQMNQPILEHLEAGLLVFDENLIIEYCNPWLNHRLKKSPKELLQKNLFETFSELKTPLFQRQIKAVSKLGTTSFLSRKATPSLLLIKARRPFDKYFSHMIQDCKLSRVTNTDGSISLCLLIQDVSEMAQIEIELQNKAKELEKANHSREQFLANASHELRTPLNAIMGLTELSILLKPEKNILNNLEEIDSSSHKLFYLVNNILDYSKLQAGQILLEKRECDLFSLLEATAHDLFSLAQAKQNTLFVCSYETQIPVLADPHRIQQILSNLILNAIQNTNSASIQIRLNTHKIDHNIKACFHIQDYGSGIDEDKIKEITSGPSQIDESATRSHEGIGLGLPIASALTELMGGPLRIESQKGKGTLVSFTLLLESGKHHATTDLPKASILLVEDNPLNQKVATKLLHKLKQNITIANHGKEALEHLQKNSFDLILMDLQMPIMDGFTATKAIRAQGISTPIIALTANTTKQSAIESKEVGMQDYFTKPINLKTFQEILLKYLT